MMVCDLINKIKDLARHYQTDDVEYEDLDGVRYRPQLYREIRNGEVVIVIEAGQELRR